MLSGAIGLDIHPSFLDAFSDVMISCIYVYLDHGRLGSYCVYGELVVDHQNSSARLLTSELSK